MDRISIFRKPRYLKECTEWSHTQQHSWKLILPLYSLILLARKLSICWAEFLGCSRRDSCPGWPSDPQSPSEFLRFYVLRDLSNTLRLFVTDPQRKFSSSVVPRTSSSVLLETLMYIEITWRACWNADSNQLFWGGAWEPAFQTNSQGMLMLLSVDHNLSDLSGLRP